VEVESDEVRRTDIAYILGRYSRINAFVCYSFWVHVDSLNTDFRSL
jgi:hypothetical protein